MILHRTAKERNTSGIFRPLIAARVAAFGKQSQLLREAQYTDDLRTS
jgi:hypothetical protein